MLWENLHTSPVLTILSAETPGRWKSYLKEGVGANSYVGVYFVLVLLCSNMQRRSWRPLLNLLWRLNPGNSLCGSFSYQRYQLQLVKLREAPGDEGREEDLSTCQGQEAPKRLGQNWEEFQLHWLPHTVTAPTHNRCHCVLAPSGFHRQKWQTGFFFTDKIFHFCSTFLTPRKTSFDQDVSHNRITKRLFTS